MCALNSNPATTPCPEQAAASFAKSTGEGTRTTGSGYHPLPFSALPHQLRRDLKGNPQAISLAAALLEYARTKAYCYPTTARLAADLGVCQNTVRAALRALQKAGWIRIVLGSNQPNGRTIWLTWLEPSASTHATKRDVSTCGPAVPQVSDSLQPTAAVPQVSDPLQPTAAPLQPAAAPLQPAAVPLQPSAAECRISGEEETKRNVVSPTKIPDAPVPPAPLPRPALPPATPVLAPMTPPVASPTPAPAPAPITTLPISGPDVGLSRTSGPMPTPGLEISVGTQAPTTVQPLLDELKALGPGTTPGDVRRLAARLAAALQDPGSLGGYIAAIGKVVAGTLARDRLIAAYKAGLGSVGKAQRPGAIFQYTLANFTPPPRPSEIRYYQTRTTSVPNTNSTNTNRGPVQCMAPGSRIPGCDLVRPGGTGAILAEPAPTAEDLAALREYAGNPRHPLRNVARRRLEELGLQ